ncbi:hypothetical protein QYM46_13795 [Brevibacterium sp. K11IcPPYGO002]|uniref:hypothetical protein n=1 Tax=Brevibacterium sp. K11IcPPYGO002 TaxID=3058837 RepID=UPI003D81AFAB
MNTNKYTYRRKPMGNAFTNQPMPTHCKRCGRTYQEKAHDSGQWNIDFASGYVTGLICPRCQTAEDVMEAQANDLALEGSTIVEWDSLSSSEKNDVIHDAIYQRAVATIEKHKKAAQMAGDTHVMVDPASWGQEAVDSWPGIKGQSAAVRTSANSLATDIITQVLGLNKVRG